MRCHGTLFYTIAAPYQQTTSRTGELPSMFPGGGISLASKAVLLRQTLPSYSSLQLELS